MGKWLFGVVSDSPWELLQKMVTNDIPVSMTPERESWFPGVLDTVKIPSPLY